ncbi:hypothetical protein JYT76_03585 [Olleya sp. AH-315-F22]|nr:hypothetical protein [Olleya sp. AH-315-F22]
MIVFLIILIVVFLIGYYSVKGFVLFILGNPKEDDFYKPSKDTFITHHHYYYDNRSVNYNSNQQIKKPQRYLDKEV